MKKPSLGTTIIVALSLIPVLLWVVFGQHGSDFASLSIELDRLARVAAIVGITLLSINIILSARLKIFNKLFHGLDRMYRVHHTIGCLVLILILAHASLLTLSYANLSLISGYQFLVDFHLPLLVGKAALVLMASVILVVLYIKVSYRWFINLQRLLGAVIFLGGYHALFQPNNDIRSNTPLFIYMVLIGGFAAGVYVYRSLFHKPLQKHFKYTIVSVKQLGEITEICLEPVGTPLRHYSGQFAFIRFISQSVSGESHPFSIASGSNSKTLRFCVKNLGDFTSTLPQLKVGEPAYIDGPHGQFSFTKLANKKQIWIAGGIGITPFLSMAQSLTSKQYVDLYYTVNGAANAVFLPELSTISTNLPNFRVAPVDSQQKGVLTAEYIAKSSDVLESDILLCGPPAMTAALTKQFLSMGVPRSRIHFEEFSL